MNDFFKFPSTPHLAVLGNAIIRDDKVFSEAERKNFLQHSIYVEEKIDGANLGISFDHSGNFFLQNRGNLLHFPLSGQWKKLETWLLPKFDILFDILSDRYILFGEWCYAQHSIIYTRLPDLFLGFDIYDKREKFFFPLKKRNSILRQLKILRVPLLGEGIFTLEQLTDFFTQSSFSNNCMEGIYLRRDNETRLINRAKLVVPDFIQTMEVHWSDKKITPNTVTYSRP